MKVSEAIDGIATFFNDIVGAIVPGAALCVALWVMHSPDGIRSLLKTGDGALALMLAGLFFAAGHAALSLFDMFNKLFSGRLALLDEPGITGKASRSTAYIAFEKLLVDKLNMAPPRLEEAERRWSFNEMRSIAFTVSGEAGALGRRFMFISLLCQGMSATIAVVVIDYVACLIFAPGSLVTYGNAWPAWVQVPLLSAVAYLFLARARMFYRMAMSAPFVVALAELKYKAALDGQIEQ